jgi:H+/Cl- antiporter ClcA
VSATTEPPAPPPITRSREFWVLTGYAVALGVFGGFAGLLFLGLIDRGEKWNVDSNPRWLGGHWWWVAVTAGAGLAVGLMHRFLRVPEQTPGIVAELKTGQVDAPLVPGIVAISAVSLIGGASLGPEKALGSMGGGVGTWIAKRRTLDKEDSQVNVLSGMAGAYGGLLSSPVIAVMLILEVARPGGNRFAKTITSSIVSASVSFGIYFAIAGSVFLDIYKVPQYRFEDWQLLMAIPLGLFAALVVTVLVLFIQLSMRLFGRVPIILRATLGGLVFGIVGVALPLTLFTGSSQLTTVIHDAGTLGIGLVVAIVIAKIFTFAVSQSSGFIGGPIFPSLFIGGTAGVLVHDVIPSVPLGLAFTCVFAAVPGALVSAPFTVVLLAAFVTQVGALQTAPVLIAVVTAFLTMEGVKSVVASRKASRITGGVQSDSTT